MMNGSIERLGKDDSAAVEGEYSDSSRRIDIDALVENRNGVNWPENTPVCLMAATNNLGGTVDKPWLAPRHRFDDQVGSIWRSGSWFGPLKCRSREVNQLGALYVEPEDDETARQQIAHARLSLDAGLIDAEEFEDVQRRARQQSRQIRLRGQLWNWADLGDENLARAGHAYLQCFDNWGHGTKGGYSFDEQVGLIAFEDPTKRPASVERVVPDRERTVFTYDYLGPDHAGRPQVALKCCHGRYLKLDNRLEILIPDKEAEVGDDGVALTVGEPCTATVHFLEYGEPDMGHVTPKISYRSTVTNHSTEVIDKEFAFEHEKSLSGEHRTEQGHSVSVGATVSYGGGFGAEASFEYGFTQQKSWAETHVERTTVTDSATIRVPAHTELDVSIVVKQRQVTIPYTYEIRRRDLAGNHLPTSPECHGIYENVETLSTEVKVDNIRDLRSEPDTSR
jgi:hypothetical protein